MHNARFGNYAMTRCTDSGTAIVQGLLARLPFRPKRFRESARLEKAIRRNLKELGYGG